MTAPLPAARRWHEVDGLRGVCALAVMLFHYIFRADPIIPAASNTLIFSIPGAPDRLIGEVWVYVFFMISGFVISLSLERCRTPMEFLVSRAARLYPVYWAVTLMMAALWAVAAPLPWQIDLLTLFGNLTMFQQFFGIRHINGVYWSLTAELAFYAGMAAVFWIGFWRRLEAVVALWLGASIAFAVACALVGPHNVPVPTIVASALNLFFAPYFCAGIVFYLVASSGWNKVRRGLIGACLVGFFAHLPPVPAAAMCGAVGLWILIVSGRAGFLAWRPLRALGDVSYALYLCHLVLGYHVLALWPEADMSVRVAAASAASIGLAALLTYRVERPALSFLRRSYGVRDERPSALSA